MTRPIRIPFLATAAALSLTALAITACGDDANSTSATAKPPTTSDGQAATVGVSDVGDLGKILVDSRGRTLYLFEADSGTESTCTGACATAWPPLIASGTPAAGDGLTASKLGTAKRSDGKAQVTYDGHPLYRFASDQKPGDADGQGSTAFGAAWYAVSPSGAKVTGKARSSGDGGDSGGGGGYGY